MSAAEEWRVAGIPKCATCVHWDPSPLGEYDYDGPGEPQWRTDDRWGICKFIPHGWGFDQSIRAFTRDASNYASSLSTRNDFGCIEHEAKPPTKEQQQ